MINGRNLPLEGLKVVELATVVAAPTAGRMLCAYGAEVIKVEGLTGDNHRRCGEFEMVVCEDDKNPLFTVQNSGKRLVSIDLKSEGGIEAMYKLLAEADIFLTNVRMPSLERLGLGWPQMHERFPKLIYGHFSGFGLKGKDCAKPGFDMTAFWLRNGPLADWQTPGAFPFTPTYAFGDMATSSVLVSGLLMAVIGRERTGEGTLVSVSLEASGIWCNAIGVVSHQPPFGGKHVNDPLRPADPFYYFYKCADGKYIAVCDNEYKTDMPKIAKLFGLDWMLEDEKYYTLENLAKTDAVVDVMTAMNEIMATKTSIEWINVLESNNISCELMRSTSDVHLDEQAIANEYVMPVTFKDDLTVVMPCPPVKFSGYDMREYTPTGRIGADTDAVFAELDYTQDEINALREKKSII